MAKAKSNFTLVSGSGKTQLVNIAHILARQAARDEFVRQSQKPQDEGAHDADKNHS